GERLSTAGPGISLRPQAPRLSIGGRRAPKLGVPRKPMPEAETATKPLPVVPYLKIPEGGEPYLEGQKCGHCGAIFLGERMVCASCGTRNQMSAVKLSNQGKLYNYTVVHRNF